MTLNYSFQWIDDIFDGGTPQVREWTLLSTLKHPLYIIVTYILVVKFIGPAVMRKCKPLDLRTLMVAYNFGLVAAYLYIISKVFIFVPVLGHEFYCGKIPDSLLNPLHREFMVHAYYLYILKYIELFDTVFLVTRKKFHMITPLHVIHHSVLPLIGFIYFRTEKGTYVSVYAGINSILHAIMYSYYGLAALGPQYQKYLWWKKYLTMLQIVQFVVMAIYMTVMWYIGCMSAGPTLWIVAFFTILFLWMFINFYQASFMKHKKIS